MSATRTVLDERGAAGPGFHLITSGNRMPTRLPWLPAGAIATQLATPRCGATFWEAHITVPTEGRTRRVPIGHEHVLYVLSGEAEVSAGEVSFALSGAGSFAYISEADAPAASFGAGASILWIARRYVALEGCPAPPSFAGAAPELDPLPLGPEGALRRELLPGEDLRFDCAVNLMAFEPGVGLDRIEIHDEDHGIYFTEGGGTYRLGSDTFAVEAEDFIFLAPYCPQGYVSRLEGPSEYLLYKPANRGEL